MNNEGLRVVRGRNRLWEGCGCVVVGEAKMVEKIWRRGVKGRKK